MSQALINAAMRVCATLDSAIEAMYEDESLLKNDGASETLGELLDAYTVLSGALSAELGGDARQLVRDVAAAEIEAWRAILRAKELM
jgi:hypothetical protein